MKQLKGKYGYSHVNLYNKAKNKFCTVHRLVAKAFILNPENKPQVNHIDGNKLNNKIDNLEWCSCSENIKHSYNVNLRVAPWKGKKGKDNPTSKAVKQYDLEGLFIKEWDSLTEAEKELSICKGKISMCCKGKRKKAGGFKWEYANGER